MSLAASVVDTLVEELQELLGDRVSTSPSVLERHGHDEAWYETMPPDAVVFPHTTEEVVEIVKICRRHRAPVIPYGTGTSLEAHIQAPHGGVSVDVQEMNQILEVNAEDLDCRIQPGVRRMQLNEYLRDTGLFFPVDPGADASLGGMTATRASGTNAVRYGTMRENVLGLTVVLADGRVIKTGGRARKSAAGYDLTRVFVGSEGTLGLITEVTLRLYGIPEAISAAVVAFDDIEGAVNTTILTIQSGVPVARIELLDEVQMQASIDYSGLDYPAKPTLFLEFHGSEAGVKEQVKTVDEIAAEFGGGEFQWTTQAEERTKLWQARHDAAYADKALKPGGRILATDVCVPISRLTECILETKADIAQTRLIAPFCGHVGDGNFHVAVPFDPEDEEEVSQMNWFNERLVKRALAMGGTCTGEHGIGIGKAKYMRAEHGEAVDVMQALKQAIDPDNLMNPGKMFTN
ncbi:MAG: FAD-linked oxidase C-terminal domain-containing protein [Alphaproteobacteria bacterium]|jgi:D-lactate dehydrogenase (cytochrome)|nr:FAD-linked oxidase C-terminal domain-containing protein [Alphaproteobacteria bacterium]